VGILKFESAFLLVFVHNLEVGINKVLTRFGAARASRLGSLDQDPNAVSDGALESMVEELANWVRRH
jgi:hypothetical protein